MSSRALVVAFSVTTLAACSGNKGGERCVERSNSIATKLAKFAGPPQILVPNGEVPRSPLGNPIDEWGPTVVLDETSTRYNHELIADFEQLAARHEQELRAYESVRAAHDRGPLPVYLEVAPQVAAARVLELRKALPASVPVRLLLRAPNDAGDPLADADPKVREEIEDILIRGDPVHRAAMMAEKTEAAIGTCGSIIGLFDDLASHDADGKSKALVDGFASALRGCDCKVNNLDKLEYLLLAVLWGGPDRFSYVSLSETGSTISVSAEMTVGKLVESLPVDATSRGVNLVP